MRRIFFFFIFLLVIAFCGQSVMAADTNMAVGSALQSEDPSVETIADIAKSSLSVGSFVITILVPTLIVFLGLKEIPKKYIPIFSFCFVTIVVLYRLGCRFFKQAEIFGTFYLTGLIVAVLIGIVIAYNKLYGKNKEELESGNLEIKSQKRAVKYIKAKIKKCHTAIESIQLYNCFERESENKQAKEYRIEYIDGAMKPGIEINALLGMNLSLDKETIEEANGIISFYNNYNNAVDDFQLDTSNIVLTEAISRGVSRIRGILSQINDSNSVGSTECCLARVLMIYCSILASLDKETTFVGFGKTALGLAEDIEERLFTNKRTGILGAILLENYPYGFYYSRHGDKSGRMYCSFAINSSKQNMKYLVLVAFRIKNKAIVPGIGVSGSLMKIKEELAKILTPSYPKGGE